MYVKKLNLHELDNRWQKAMLLQRTLFPLSLSHILQLSLYAKQNVHFPFENKATQRPTDKSTDEWNKQGGRVKTAEASFELTLPGGMTECSLFWAIH